MGFLVVVTARQSVVDGGLGGRQPDLGSRSPEKCLPTGSIQSGP